jgi:hypothetical protein
MKKMNRALALVLAVGMLLVLCSCGGDKSEIKQSISKFESACQKGDAETVVEYIDPAVASPILGISSLVGTLIGEDSGDVLNSVVSFFFGLEDQDSAFLQSINIDVKDVAVNGDTATALCDVSYTVNGTDYQKDATISMTKVEGADIEWRISGIDFN